MLLKFMCVVEPSIPRVTIGNEPSHQASFIRGEVPIQGGGILLHVLVVVYPSLVRRHDIAIPPIRGGPVNEIVVLQSLRMVRTLQQVHYPNLKASETREN